MILPIVMQWLLDGYGFRTTLRVWAIVIFVLTAPLLYFVKGRVPLSQISTPRQFDYTFLKTSTFSILQTGNIIEGLGFFLPSIYLPTYARSLGASVLTSTLTIILFNVASVFGCVIMGTIIDFDHRLKLWSIRPLGSFYLPGPPLHVLHHLRPLCR